MEHREADDIDKIPLWEAQKQLLELFKPAHETNENAIKSIKDYINKQEQNFMKNWWQKRNAGMIGSIFSHCNNFYCSAPRKIGILCLKIWPNEQALFSKHLKFRLS